MSYVIKMPSYQIHIGEGILQEVGSLLADYKGRKACIITDSNVSCLYGEALSASLSKAGLLVEALVVPAGETTKSAKQLLHLYSQMAKLQISRSDLIVALGGGVVGDLAGMVAATYMRGINLVQIPTTLLSQVDSSVGGKVAIDLPEGKNLVGSFYNPCLVLADTQLLETLDDRQKAAGKAEIIKYGCIKDPDLFKLLEQNSWSTDELVGHSVVIKKSYIDADPLDQGVRGELNFGHTLAHALESSMGYGCLLHGEAVAIGMMAAVSFGERIGVTADGVCSRLKDVLLTYNLPFQLPDVDMNKVHQAIKLDKKGVGNLVLLRRIGEAFFYHAEARDLVVLTEVKCND